MSFLRKGEDERRVCKYYGRKGSKGCWRGDACPFEHIEPHRLRETEGALTRDERPVFCIHDADSSIQPKVGTWLAVQVTHIFNPAHFYVTFPFGVKPVLELMKEEENNEENTGDEGYSSTTTMAESIERLCDAMNDHYSRLIRRDTDLVTYASGEIVAAPYSEDGCWYRARVIDCRVEDRIEDSQVHVFFVDFGNDEWVKEGVIRQMQPQFMHLPFQAIECFLPLEPDSNDRTWPAEAVALFRELVDEKILFAHIKALFPSMISCDLYDTTGEAEVNVSSVLTERGHALAMSSRSCSTSLKSESSEKQYLPG